jgi:hypothetical protein
MRRDPADVTKDPLDVQRAKATQYHRARIGAADQRSIARATHALASALAHPGGVVDATTHPRPCRWCAFVNELAKFRAEVAA